MTMTTGAATTFLGNIAGGPRPMGHDGVAQDALVAVPVGLFNSLIAQQGWYGSHMPVQYGGAYAPQFGAQHAGGRPQDLIAVPAHLFHSLIGQQGFGQQGFAHHGIAAQAPYAPQGWYSNQFGAGIGAPAAGVLPFQVIPNGVAFR